MGYGVVDMQHIEAEVAADLGHFDRKRKGVIRVFEEIVIVNHNLVKTEAIRIRRQAKGTFVTDEVHFVPEPSKVFTQSRSEDSATTDRGITGDSNFERAVGIH